MLYYYNNSNKYNNSIIIVLILLLYFTLYFLFSNNNIVLSGKLFIWIVYILYIAICLLFWNVNFDIIIILCTINLSSYYMTFYLFYCWNNTSIYFITPGKKGKIFIYINIWFFYSILLLIFGIRYNFYGNFKNIIIP